MRKFLLALGLLLSLTVGTARAQFCAGAPPYVFTDVLVNDAFCGFITWMATTGITTGCQIIDANNRRYCPDDVVTRKQMSAFMSRLGRDTVFADGGNAFGVLPNNTAVVGTTDGNALDIRVGGARVMRYAPHATSPSVIGGHPMNDATGMIGATIGGGGGIGTPNRVTHSFGTVGGGISNVAGDNGGPGSQGATVGGGVTNVASGSYSTVAGGLSNVASGGASTVAGGVANIASGNSSTVAGGDSNTAIGTLSFAAGYRAKATATGSFVWADSRNADFGVPVANFFAVRATGGVGFTVAIDPVSGGGTQYCDLLPGVVGWQCVSDRNAKENFELVHAEEVLAKLLAMPLFSWNFKGADPALRNLGPTAQDFHAAFGLGSNPKTIASGNVDGVALAAIQGLNAKLEDREAALRREVRAKDGEIAALRHELADLRIAVEVLTARPSTEGRLAQTR